MNVLAATREPLACANEKQVRAAEWPGLAVSALAHGLALVLILVAFKAATHTMPAPARFLPVDIVLLGDDTQSPSAMQRAPIPQQSAARHLPSAAKPESETPAKEKAVPDEFENRLRALAKLHQPDSALAPIDNGGIADADASNGVPGTQASYSVKDYIRAQVLRRWSLNLAALGSRNFTVLIHVGMTGAGVVTAAEIVNTKRAATDKAYREIALSARNAVILSSPFALPRGRFANGLDFTLDLNPRDTLR